MPAGRRRLADALGLGPLWIRRLSHPADDEDGADLRRRAIASLAWQPLQDAVASCVACALSRSRSRTVFGHGPSRPEWLVLGAAPDAEEDLQGLPFKGQAGRLLDAMLTSLGLSRQRDVFVANVLKCRPPDDRRPSPGEMACCRPFIDRQVALLDPRLVLVVGDVACEALLGPRATVAATRGRRHAIAVEGREVPAVTTFHPDELLRSAEAKAEAWADLCLARALYEETMAPAS